MRTKPRGHLRQHLARLLVGLTLASISPTPALGAAAPNGCAVALNLPATPAHGPHQSTWTPAEKEAALRIMLEGSANVSRTKVHGQILFPPEDIPLEQVSTVTAWNFEVAARYVLDHFEDLPVTLATAETLIELLTRKIEPDTHYAGTQSMARTKFDYRVHGKFVNQCPECADGTPRSFYAWLESPQAKQLQKENPVVFAETVHNDVVALDSFADSNGRLSRMLADLALLRGGFAPASYTDMEDYFARGSARSPVTREQRQAYFREIVRSGESRLHDLLRQNP